MKVKTRFKNKNSQGILMVKRGNKVVLKPFFSILAIVLFLGLIVAPASYLLFSSSPSSDAVFFNGTEIANGSGIRTSAAVLSMDFNSAPENTNPFIYGGQYVKDNSLYNNFGSKADTHPWNPGKVNGSLGFDGADDKVIVPYNASIDITNLPNWTISAWLYMKDNGTSNGDTLAIFSQEPGDATTGMAIVRSNGKLATWAPYVSALGGVKGNTNLSLNQWVHIVVSYDGGSNTTYYINGTLDKTFASENPIDNTEPLYIGTRYKGLLGTAYSNFNGSMDEIMIFNRTLSSSEVSQLYGNQTLGNQSYLATDANLVSYYKFEELSGTTSGDSKGSNIGTLTNYTTDTSPAWNSTGGPDGSGAYQFDGVNDYMSIADSSYLDPTNVITISVWVRNNVVTPYSAYVLGKLDAGSTDDSYSIIYGYHGQNYELYGNGLSFYTSGASKINLTDINWHLITYTFNGATWNGYKDGILNVSYNSSTPIQSYTGSLILGAFNSASRYFNGSIDNVQIFNRALSASEILALYNGTLANKSNKYSATQGDFKSGVFYNSTQTYWNVTLSTADTTARSGLVNADNSINLSNPNLVSYWALDGNYRDGTGRNNGTCTSCPNNASGLSSGAMRFDGADDYINISNSANLNISGNAITISGWIYPYSTTNYPRLLAKPHTSYSEPYYIYTLHLNNAKAEFGIATGGTRTYKNGTTTINTNQWTHITGTYNGSTMTIYVNGVSDGSKSQTGNIDTNNKPVFIGRLSDADNVERFNGSIDEVLIYNTSLSASQISQLYKSGLSQHANTNITIQTRTADSYNVTDPSLVALWGFNNATGENATFFKDETGRNNGTCSGTTCPSLNSSGVVGNAYTFDGINDSIDLSTPSSLDFTTNNFTLSAWVKRNSLSNYAAIIDKDNSSSPLYFLWLNASNYITFQIRNTSGVGVGLYSTSAIDNNWHHIMAIRQDNSAFLYLDGVQVATTSSSPSGSIRNNGPTSIGSNDNGGSRRYHFNGSIDEVRIYNRSLSDAEVLDLYNLGTTHINWDNDANFTNEQIARDNSGYTSSNYSKFLQLKAKFYSNNTDRTPYLLSYNITSLGNPPNVTLNTPANASSLSTLTADIINWILSRFSILFSASSDLWITNASESVNLGARTSAPILSMDFNIAPENYSGTNMYVKDSSVYNNFAIYNFSNTNPVYNETSGISSSGAYTFDGINDYMVISHQSMFTFYSGLTDLPFSITTWIYPRSYGASIINKGDTGAGTSEDYALSLNASGSLCLNLYDTSVSAYIYNCTNAIIPLNTWSFVGVAFAGSMWNDGINLFVNGTFARSSGARASYTDMRSSTNSIYIGSFGTTGALSTHFNGTIDNLQMYKRKLSASEITDLYNGTISNRSTKYSAKQSDLTFSFYNSTTPFWGINISTIDGYFRSGLVNSDNSINISNPNLVAYWPLDGNYNDAKGLNNGLAVGRVNNASGLSSEAMKFDGSTGFFNGTNSSAIISTSLWVNSSTTWVHLAFNGSTFFTNGVAGLSYYAYPLNVSGGQFKIGLNKTGALFFGGFIDEVVAYNTSINREQVLQLYKSGLAKKATTNITIQYRTSTGYNISDPYLVASFGFNGNTLDETGRHNGTIIGSLYNNYSGMIGNSYGFFGSSDSINTTVFYNYTNSTISLWFYTRDGCSRFGVCTLIWQIGPGFTDQDGIKMANAEINRFYIYASHNRQDSSSVRKYLTLNEWHHVASTSNLTGTYLYIDGSLLTSFSSGGFTSKTVPLTMGVGLGLGGAASSTGTIIDEVRIYNRSLSAAEVSSLYSLGSTYISNWTNWAETIVNDGVQTNTTTAGNILQLKMNLNSNTTEVTPYITSYNISVLRNNPQISYVDKNLTANISSGVGVANATLYVVNFSNQSQIISQTTNTFASGVLSTTIGIVVSLVDGIYNWFYSIFDRNNNSFTSINNTITIDTTSPNVTLNTPENNLILNRTNQDTAIQTYNTTSGYNDNFFTLSANNSESTSNIMRISASILSMDFNSPSEYQAGFTSIPYNTSTSNAVTNNTYVKDNSVYNNYGTLPTNYLNESAWMNFGSKVNNSLQFDGTDDYVNVSNTYTTNTAFTISMWTNLKAYGSWKTFISGTASTNGPMIRITDTNKYTAACDNIYFANSGFNIPLNSWMMLTEVFNGSTIMLYVNGTLSASVVGSCTGITGYRIGARSDGNYINASIDEVMIFNRSLSSDEITNLYSNQSAGNQSYLATDSNIVSYWKFDDLSESRIPDSIGGRFNGTLINYPSLTSPTYNATGGPDGSGAYQFDGSNDYISQSAAKSLTYTITGWVKNSTATSWSFISWASDGVNYTNGVVSNPSQKPFNWTRIGIQGATYFNGTIDNINIYNRTLSASEVLAMYNGTLANKSNKYSATQGDFKSLVFYNSTQTYWNISLSTADTQSRSGLVNPDNSINLSNPNLVSYWPLDGNYRDGTGRNNGTCTSGTCPNNASGLSSGAMRFDGADDFVNITDNINIGNNSFTISGWFNSNSGSATQAIISKRDGDSTNIEWNLLTISGRLFFGTFNSGGSAGNTVSLPYTSNTWYFFTILRNSTNTYLYLNGVTNMTSNTANIVDSNSPYKIGARHSTPELYFNGSISDVAVYNTSLTQTQITQLYKSGLSKKANTNVTIQTRTANSYNVSDPSLVAFWGLNNGTGENATFFKDETGRNNGTCSGTTCPSLNSSGVVGNAMKFDGVNDYISIIQPLSLNLIANYSFSLWMQPTNVTSSHVILSRGGGSTSNLQYLIDIENGVPMIWMSNGTTAVNALGGNVLVNNWYHLVGIHNGTRLNIYINGVWINSSNVLSNSFSNTTMNNAIGAYSVGSVPFAGSIDEVRIYNRSLSAAEVQDLYELGATHLSDWTAWTSEALTSDGAGVNTNVSSKFVQYRAGLYSNTTDQSPYVVLGNVSALIVNNAVSTINLTANISDDGTGIVNATLYIVNATNTSQQVVTSTLILNNPLSATIGIVVSLIDGFYQWFYRIFDFVGNSQVSSNNSLLVDNILPNVILNTPADNIYTNSLNINFTANVTDNVFVKNASVYIYNSTNSVINQTTNSINSTSTSIGINLSLADGNYTWFYDVFDYGNYRNISGNNTLTVDTVLPVPIFTSPTPDNSSGSNQQITLMINVTELYPKNATLDWGNETTRALYYFNLANFTQIDANTYQFNTTNKTGLLAGQLYYYNITVCDQASNCNTTQTRLVRGNTAPIITLNSDTTQSGNYSANQIIANITFSDGESNLNASFIYLYYRNNWQNSTIILLNETFDNSSTSAINLYLNYSNLSQGLYYLNATATDNVGEITNSSIRTILLDTQNPAIISNMPLDNYYSSTSAVTLSANTTENLGIKNITLYVYNLTSLVNQTEYNITNLLSVNQTSSINLSDTNYTWYYQVYDYAHNSNITLNRTLIIDTTYPQILFNENTRIDAINISSSNIPVGINFSEINFANITYNLYNATYNGSNLVNHTLVNSTIYLDMTSFVNFTNLPDSYYLYNVSIIDKAGNKNDTQTRIVLLDTTNPNASLITPLNLSYLNYTSVNLTANLSDNLGIANATLNIYNYSNSSQLINQTILYFAQGTVSTTVGIIVNLVDGWYSWFYQLFDWANNQFTTENNTLITDTINPSIASIVLSPYDNDSFDPNTRITFNVSLIDDTAGINSSYLEIFNSTDWTNYTMNLVNGTIYDGVWNTSFTTLPEEKIYQYRIWTNDKSNNINETLNQSIYAYYDCTWNVSTGNINNQYAFESVGGFYQEKALGNITIRNTGDVEYANNNCSITFSNWNSYTNLSADYWSQTSWPSDGSRGLKFYYSNNLVSSLEINVSENKTIVARAIFPRTSSLLNEYPYFTLTASINNSETRINNITITARMVITPGAYLDTAFEPSSQTVYLTAGNFTLPSYIRNLVDASDNLQNNTAYNINQTLTIDSTLQNLLSSGDLNLSLDILNTTAKTYNNLTFTLTTSNIVSMPLSTYYAYSNLIGYENSSGNLSLINYGNNQTQTNASASVTFACYSTKDSVCVSACINLTANLVYDPDCSIPSTTTTVSGGTGGGGGGGGGGVAITSNKIEKSEATYELLRGASQTFQLEIKNKYPQVIENLIIDVSGLNSEYIALSEKSISSLAPGESRNITVTISAPAYFTGKKYELVFDISGLLITESGGVKSGIGVTDKRAVTLYILEVSRQEADNLSDASLILVNEMNLSSMNTKEALSLLEQQKKAYDNLDFLQVKNIGEKINLIYSNAFESKKTLEELTLAIKEAERNGITTYETQKMVYLAQVAYERGDYTAALERLRQAKLVYAVETKGEFNLLVTIKNNPLESMGIILAVAIAGTVLTFAVRLRLYKRKLKSLTEEEVLLLELMKMVQRQCFEQARLSMEEYDQAMLQYESKLSETIEEKIRTETKIANLIKIGGKKKALDEEKKRIIQLIKNVQDDYLNKGKIETRIYENMLKSYSTRLTEVDEQLAYAEAQEALKKQSKLKGDFKV